MIFLMIISFINGVNFNDVRVIRSFFNWGIVVLQCCVSTVHGVPCAIQQVLISYLFYTY